MAKRFFDSDIYTEDWYRELPNNCKGLFFYILAHCNDAGFWRPNKNDVEAIFMCRFNFPEFIKLVNKQTDVNSGEVVFRERIRVLQNGRWWVKDYFRFQYGGLFYLHSQIHYASLRKMIEMGLHPKEWTSAIEGEGVNIGKLAELELEEIQEMVHDKTNRRRNELSNPKDKPAAAAADRAGAGELSNNIHPFFGEKTVKLAYNDTEPAWEKVADLMDWTHEQLMGVRYGSKAIQPESFELWKQFCVFVADKNMTALRLPTDFISPADMQKLIDAGLTVSKWEEVTNKLIASGQVRTTTKLFFEMLHVLQGKEPTANRRHNKKGGKATADTGDQDYSQFE